MATDPVQTGSPSPTPNVAGKTEKVTFTEKEERVLQIAWHCLKSGAPEIDIKKLTELGGFNTEKTASNTWGVIKKKLGVGPATPGAKKTTASPGKKRGKAESGDDDQDVAGGASVSPTKKREGRKVVTKTDAPADDEDDAPPQWD